MRNFDQKSIPTTLVPSDFVSTQERGNDWVWIRDWTSDILLFCKKNVLGSVVYFHVVTKFLVKSFFKTLTGLTCKKAISNIKNSNELTK